MKIQDRYYTFVIIMVLLVIICLDLISEKDNDSIMAFSELPNKSHLDILAKELNHDRYLKGIAEIDGFILNFDLALTDKQKHDGLSIKSSMQENEGMLFIFDEPTRQSFWMKGMKFPIDIIWLDENLSIVHIEKSLDPCETWNPCPAYKPTAEALYVLETISGFSEEHDLKIGKRINMEIS